MRGFTCTPIALRVYGDKCPWLSGLELNNIGNKAEVLWTDVSLNVAHIVLYVFWILGFVALATLIGNFAAYQQRPVQRNSKKSDIPPQHSPSVGVEMPFGSYD